jgi:regulator of replication initiation timing
MKDNNIGYALSALGEKIGDLENDLSFSELRNSQLTEENQKLREENDKLQRKLDNLTDKLNEYCERSK